MKQTELSLYLKRSSIYNKISQIIGAIAIIIVVLSLWSISNQKNLAHIDEHFSIISEQHMQQVQLGISLALKNGLSVQDYVDQAVTQPWLRSIHWYSPTGTLLAQSELGVTIKDLYGINDEKLNRSDEFVPFVKALRTDKLEGFVRMTIKKSQLTESLYNINDENLSLFRLILLLSGIVGFLLTRGFNRFSRQGYRLDNGRKEKPSAK